MEKKILYLEIDEEITSVIDRLKKAEGTEIHLVVPKEAALLQSIVNLKLLKRQADSLDKKIQIITHDKVGRNLAEQVGIHSTSRVGEKVNIPEKIEEEPDIKYKETESALEDTKEIVFKKGAVVGKKDKEKEEPEEKEDEEKPTGKKKTSDFLPKFPHKKFIIIAAAIFLVFSIFLYIYVPMTKINLKVLSEKQDMKADFTVEKDLKEVNVADGKIPGNLIIADKTVTKKYPATGKKNIGAKAQGTVTLKNNYSTSAQTIVAGTRLEAGGLVFKTQSDVSVPGYTDPPKVPGTANVSVIADSAGDNYNVGPSDFKIPAFSGTAKYDTFTGTSGGSMSGGTTKEVKVISASDISEAKKSFVQDAQNDIKKEGEDKLGKGETLDDKAKKISIGAISVSKNPDDESDDFTISAPAAFKGLSYKEDDLNKVVYDNFKSKTSPNKQILEDKAEGVSVTPNEVDLEKGTMSGEAQATMHLGTKIDEKQLKDEISGKGESKAKEYVKSLEGVDSVEMSFSPSFWKTVSRLKSHIYFKTEFSESQ